MPSPLGVALVGCGTIARFHARALAEIDDVRLVALVSRSEAAAKKFNDELHASLALYTRLEDALARPDVHLVVVATPSGAHLEPAVAAAKAGKHVVVEKPLEITADRCDRIIDACDSTASSSARSSRRASATPVRFSSTPSKRAVSAG